MAWQPVAANVLIAPQRESDEVGRRWEEWGQSFRRTGVHDRRLWERRLLELWTLKVDIFISLRYADHVVVDVSEAHDADGNFIGDVALNIKRILKVPPCFRLRYGKDEDRVLVERKVEKNAAMFGKAMRPCRFCEKVSRNWDDFVRFLNCFQPAPMPPELPAEIMRGWIDGAKMEELVKEGKTVKD